MLEKFIFENHLEQRFDGLSNGVYLNYNDLRDYSWNYDTINSRISGFRSKITKRKLPLVVCCDSGDEAVAIMNRLHELAESDIAAKIPGKVFVGDYYTSGYITASKKSKYLVKKHYCELDLTLVSEDSAWYKEQQYTFLPSESTVGIGSGTDYPYDYKYDYALTLQGRKIVCDSPGSNAFRLLIYGEVANPSIIIGGHVYTVNGIVESGETLLIDSLSKTITLTTAAGNKINWFDKRSRENYIFEPIPSGQSTVSWNGSFGFELTAIEKRSEPKCT